MSKETTKTVEFIRNTMAGGKPVKVGEVVTLPAKEAQFLIHINRAKEYEAPAAEIPATETGAGEGEGLDLDKMKVPELKKFAADNEIELPAGAKKPEIVAAIAAEILKRNAHLDASEEETEDGEETGAGEGDETPDSNP